MNIFTLNKKNLSPPGARGQRLIVLWCHATRNTNNLLLQQYLNFRQIQIQV